MNIHKKTLQLYIITILCSSLTLLAGCSFYAQKNDVQDVVVKQEELQIEENGVINENTDVLAKKKNDYIVIEDSDNNFTCNYRIGKREVYFNDVLLSNDGENFKVLKFCYAKDSNNAYHNGLTIQGVDVRSFKFFANKFIYNPNSVSYAIDDKNVYINNEKLKSMRSDSFVLYDRYYKDNDEVYYNQNSFSKDDLQVIDVDVATFVSNRSCDYNMNDVCEKIKLDEGDAKDKNYVYVKGFKVKKIGSDDKIIQYNNYFVLSDNTILYKMQVMQDVDVESFEIIQLNYSKDKKNVYLDNILIEDADPETFFVLNNCEGNCYETELRYSRDDKNGYYRGNKISNSDGKSFTIDGLENCLDYSKDKHNLYWKTTKVEGVNVDDINCDYVDIVGGVLREKNIYIINGIKS